MNKKRYNKDKEFARVIALRIKQLRQEYNCTQEKLIDKTHLDINRYEMGETIPLLSSLSKICEFFNITLDEFFAPMQYPPKK